MMNRLNLFSVTSISIALVAGFLSAGGAVNAEAARQTAWKILAPVAHAAPEEHDHDQRNGEKASRKQRS